MQQYSNEWNHIAIYSRSDDEYIGEKIIGGCLFDNILNNLQKNYLQVFCFPKSIRSEISFVNCETILGQTYEDMEEFKKMFQDTYNQFNFYL